MTVILCGQKACGKTTIGTDTAKKLGIPFYDLDKIILERSQKKFKTCRQMYTELGKDAFRNAELSAFTYILSNKGKDVNSIIALGGGSLETKSIAEQASKAGIIVYIYQDEKTLFSRMQTQGFPPFLLPDPQTRFHNLFIKRDALFKSLCSIVIDAVGKEKEDICQILLEMF